MQQRARSAHTPSPHSKYFELDEPFRQQERAFAGWLADSADIALIRSSAVDCSFAHLVGPAADSPIVMHSLNAAYGAGLPQAPSLANQLFQIEEQVDQHCPHFSAATDATLRQQIQRPFVIALHQHGRAVANKANHVLRR